MGGGGSEATAMWSLHALQDLARITFTTASPVDWDRLNATYGTRVLPERITLLPAPRMPGVNNGTRLAFWQRAYFERFCQGLDTRFDACISAYNPIRFSQPALQLIGDFSFNEACRLALCPESKERAHHRPSLLRRAYLELGNQVSGKNDRRVAGPGDRVVANSRWSATILERQFQLVDLPILYPPSSLHEPVGATQRDPLGFVCLGRIAPGKEIESIITILDRVRAKGHPVTLDIIGRFGDDAYSSRIRKMAEERREWIRTPGFLGPEEKGAVFASRSFGLHACRAEAFGIAVAEMAAAGVIPFVPSEGGTREIVTTDELVYRDPDDAVRKIIAKIRQPESDDRLRQQLIRHVENFHPERFAESLVGLVQDFIGYPLAPT
jgi:glycosyltransferase involved in cell wall biosynthesis